MHTRLKTWLPLAVGLLLCLTLSAHAAPRMALLIGNDSYRGIDDPSKAEGHWAKLDKAKNDATAIGQALKNLGFDDVRVEPNLGRSALIKAVDDFAKRARQANAEVALLYFGGHGAQVEKRNYLIPVDAQKVDNLGQIESDGVYLDLLLSKLKNSAKLKIVWLDACRDTPGIAARSGSVGLTDVSTDERGADTVITFAAQPGKVAYEGDKQNTNGLFAQGLLSGLATRGNLFGVVSQAESEVIRLSQERQKPATVGMNHMQETFWFNPALQPPSASKTSEDLARLRQEKEQLANEKAQLAQQLAQAQQRLATARPADASKLNDGLRDPDVMGRQTPTSQELDGFVLLPGGVARDKTTGLEWMRCSLGQTWDGNTCTGGSNIYDWKDALGAAKQLNAKGGFAGSTNWRVPSIRELHGLIHCSKGIGESTTYLQDGGPKVRNSCLGEGYAIPTIKQKVFPNASSSGWSSSTYYSGDSYSGWYVNFYEGYVSGVRGIAAGTVRLVRASQ